MKKLLISLVLVLVAIAVGAKTITYDNLVYRIDDADNTKVWVQNIVSGQSIAELTIPADFTTSGSTYHVVGLDNGALWQNTSLTKVTISYGVEYIGNMAFYDCSQLKSVLIPSSVKSIGSSAFAENSNLEVGLAHLNSLPTFGSNCFDSDATIYFPTRYACELAKENATLSQYTLAADPSKAHDLKYYEGGTQSRSRYYVINSVDNSAYYTTLVGEYQDPYKMANGKRDSTYAIQIYQNLTINNRTILVTSIAPTAFYNNTKVRSLTINSDKFVSIGREAFYGCTILATVSINAPADIELYSFFLAESLNSLTLSQVKSIGDFAFAFTALSSVDIPASTINVQSTAFHPSSALQTINVSSDNPNYSSKFGFLYDKSRTTLIHVPCYTKVTTITSEHLDKVKSIGEMAFSYNKTVKSVEIPWGVTSLGYASFNNSDIEAIKIPSSVKNLANCKLLLTYCDNLKYLIVNIETPPVISEMMLEGVTSTCKLYVPHNLRSNAIMAAYRNADYWKNLNLNLGSYDSRQEWSNGQELAYTFNEDGTEARVVNAYWKGEKITPTASEVEIPSEILADDGYAKVTGIGIYAFNSNKNVTKITLPSTVTTLEGVCDSQGNQDDMAMNFGYCSNLTNVLLSPNIATIPNGCFRNAGLTELTVPYGIVEIGAYAFDCNIQKLHIPSSLIFNHDGSCLAGASQLKTLILNVKNFPVESAWASKIGFPSDIKVYVPVGDYDSAPDEYVKMYKQMSFFSNKDVRKGAYDFAIGENAVNGYATMKSYDSDEAMFVMGPSRTNVKSVTLGHTYTDALSGKTFKPVEIQQEAFYGTTKLESFSLESQLKRIPARSFFMTALKNFPFGDEFCKPDAIRDSAFYGSWISGDIELPNTIEYTGSVPFGHCSEYLNSITVPKDHQIWNGLCDLYDATMKSNFSCYVPLGAFGQTVATMLAGGEIGKVKEQHLVPFVQSDDEYLLLSMPGVYYAGGEMGASYGVSYSNLLLQGAQLWNIGYDASNSGFAPFDGNGKLIVLKELTNDGSGQFAADDNNGYLARVEPGKMYKLARTSRRATGNVSPNLLIAVDAPDYEGGWFRNNPDDYSYVLDASGTEPIFRKCNPSVDGFHFGDAFLSFKQVQSLLPSQPAVLGIFGPAGLPGDVNGDGQVGIGDIVAITNVMAGIETNETIRARADVNGDTEVGIGDIVAVTNIMAGQQ